MRLSYRFASAIIYKEPYMKELLQTFTRAPLFFIPNCVDAPPREWAGLLREERSVDFLWVNRFTPQRRALWLARSLHHEDLHETSALMLGFQDSEHIAEHVEKEQDSLLELKPKNLEIRGFSDPESHYRAAQFFCLPASLVFGNNSLLEAMSWGLVPIVTEAPGVELIVRDGINGIVTKFDEAAYQEGLVRAARMDDQEWERLSEAAKATVSREYAPATWSDRMAAAYGFIARQS
jgi:glycosyltransferase involved in cell wall biosynthesis